MPMPVMLSVVLFWLLASGPWLLSDAFAAASIRVLLVDAKSPKIPFKDEKVEQLGTSMGEVVLNGTKYTGKLEVWKGTGGIYIINEIPLEEYIKGVVAAEVGNKWDTEALKAQAVVARTYALYQKANNGTGSLPYDITSSVLHQVFKGTGIPENIAKAVEETEGEILTYEGKPIIAFYHSTSGGMTEDPLEVFGKSYPYLKPVETSCELSPFFIWEKRIPVPDVEKAINISGIKDIVIDSYTDSNRVRDLRIITESGEHTMLGKEFRRSLGWDRLPSTMVTSLLRSGNQFIFEGKGYGHGVGMCQWSALEMAQAGKDYEEILCAFYPGTSLEVFEK
ncbi:MAG: SpoIID/LytB domain-containing protein [Nitrospirota bacterium]